MPDLTAEEMRKRIRALEDQVYPDSMALPEGMPLGSPQDPSEPIHAEFVRLKEQAETPGGEAGLRGLFVDSDGFLQKVQQDGTTERVGGSRSAEEIEDIVGAMAAGVLLYDDANGQLDVPEESIEDIVGAMAAGVLAYDDANGQLDVPEESIEDIVGAMAGDSVQYDDANGRLDVAIQSGPNPFDAAESFNESSVSVFGSGIVPIDGSVQIGGPIGGASGPGDDSGTQIKTDSLGLRINPNQDLPGIQVKLSGNSGNFSRTILYDGSNILTEVTGSFSKGEKINIIYPFKSGTTYYVLAYNNGNSYAHGHDTSTSFPITSSVIDITEGVNITDPDAGDGPVLTGNRDHFVSVEGLGDDGSTSGNANIEWPAVQDIFKWDVATFTKTEDGETVNVYAAYSNDGGSTWERLNSGNPISRNFSLAAEQDNVAGFDADSEVRIEAELSRSDTANNPTLDSAYRSWRV